MAEPVVLDASALIALLLEEPGAAVVSARLEGACISTVNAAEVGDKFVRSGLSLEATAAAIRKLKLNPVAPDIEDAMDAARLFEETRSAGLSLGDRFCLALAKRLNRVALTADRRWSLVADAAGVRVELIR